MRNAHHPAYVLVVDDDEGQLVLVRTALETEGYRVTTAATYSQAQRALTEGTYEILLVDIKLPDGDGIDLLTWAREKDPNIVAIVLTAHSSADTAVAAMHHGAYDYLIKPWPPRLLVAAVRRAEEKHRLTRALAERTLELESLNKDLHRRVADSTRQIYLLNERLKRFVVELMASNDGRVRFMENLAHELKNPLSVVRGYAAFLLERPFEQWSKEDLLSAIGAIHRNSDFLQALLEELAEATSVSAHKVALRREPLSAEEETRHAVEAFQLQAQEKGITLSTDCAVPGAASSMIEADRTRLRQIISNLIANAIKYTPQGGRVTVRVRPSEGDVQFTVEDTGLGIPQKQLTHIFDRFFQSDAAPKQMGLGLGLEIAKGLVTLHGGRIWAESEVGQGSRFHFMLPCQAPQTLPPPPRRRDSPEDILGSPQR